MWINTHFYMEHVKVEHMIIIIDWADVPHLELECASWSDATVGGNGSERAWLITSRFKCCFSPLLIVERAAHSFDKRHRRSIQGICFLNWEQKKSTEEKQ